MKYKLESGEDALFSLEHGAITLESRGGSRKSGHAVNTEYGKALRAILEHIHSAGVPITDAYVDSTAVQTLDRAQRRIIDLENMPTTASALFTDMSRRMKSLGHVGTLRSGNSTKRVTIELGGHASKKRLISILHAVPADARSAERLPAKELHRVTSKALWAAREELLETHNYAPFDDSEKYDVLMEDGRRLPPKALFGKALSQVLGFQVKPKHFVGGAQSICFSILNQNGYKIVQKGSAPIVPSLPPEEQEWPEGDKKGRWHLHSERQSGLAAAKRQDFVATHGRLYCEHCGLDPLKTYDRKYADACIEVHHANVTVSDMKPGHKTKLSDLQCLCANCHRIEHRRMRALKT